MTRDDYKLVKTCSACPEQYDVMLDGEEVGYLRLRHGSFRCEYNYGGRDEVVYSASPDGDGEFMDYERTGYLNAAIEALDRRHHKPADIATGWSFA